VQVLAFLALVSLLSAAPPDLTGLWHGAFRADGGEKRSLYLALTVQGSAVTGEVETPTRNSPLVEGKLLPRGFSAIAQSDWDGKLARRPVEGRLDGSTLNVRIQAWPGGPMVDYRLKRISTETSIPKPDPIPPPPIRDVAYNGLAKTPPMGWSSWNSLGCRINDRVIREIADALVSTGLKDAGYTYLNIDDCWQGERDRNGVLQPDPERFPDMKALANYVHARGLKIGIYSSPGPKTCAGYDGSYDYEEVDARTYAAWGIDFLKYDWCSAGKLYRNGDMRAVFQKMGRVLQAAGRPIVFSICQYGLANVWEWGPKVGGNLWRTTGDIGANWGSISEIGFEKQENLSSFAGPGRWNDPDMLEVGNGNLTLDEYRTHMSLWAVLAAPLIAGNDIRAMPAEIRQILINREVIAVDQDPLGRQGSRALRSGQQEIWTKPMQDRSVVVALFNRDNKAGALKFSWTSLGFKTAPRRIRYLWQHQDIPATGSPSVHLPAHGSALWRVWIN
jgi:alpha-galactosidase